MKNIPSMQMRTVVLLLAFAIGLGIAVHSFFFIVALLIILIAMVEWTAEKLLEYLRNVQKNAPIRVRPLQPDRAWAHRRRLFHLL